MKYCLKIRVISCWLLVIGFFCFYTAPIFAQAEIESSQDVLYEVFDSGKTIVRHHVSLTNLTTTKYASEYSLFVGFVDVKNVTAADSQGQMRVDVTKQENGTDMRLFFNEPVVGKGKVLFFTLSYETTEIASHNGSIWEITIPKIKDSPELTSYTATLSVPSSFGQPTFIKPSTVDGLSFRKQDVLQGISVVFGDYQLFDYTLSYHLRNERLYSVILEIALPPETGYQEVLLNELTPKPLTVEQDADGNWLALYRLGASQTLEIKASGRVKLLHEPRGTHSTESANLRSYLLPQKYWETTNPDILARAKELRTPRAIYDYIVQTLSYDYERISKNLPRAGAAETLSNPQSAICIEFTDLFIALARAAGIAAREVDGFAFTENSRLRPLSLVKDILHAWPEYYDEEKKLWIAVDPTWGNTSGIDYFDTFDFNHFAFVMKGLESEYPYPPGSYKDEGKDGKQSEKKDIEVSFATDNAFHKMERIGVATDISSSLVAGFQNTSKIIIQNNGNVLFAGGELSLSADKLLPEHTTLRVGPIPPLGFVAVPVKLRSPSYLDTFRTTIKASLNGQDFTYEVQISPLFLIYLPWIIGGTAIGILIITTRSTWHIYLQRRQRPDPLRGQGKEPQA